MSSIQIPTEFFKEILKLLEFYNAQQYTQLGTFLVNSTQTICWELFCRKVRNWIFVGNFFAGKWGTEYLLGTFLQESEELKDVHDEFENNRSTKISQKEVDELMQELFEAYELDKEENNGAKKHKRKDYVVSV